MAEAIYTPARTDEEIASPAGADQADADASPALNMPRWEDDFMAFSVAGVNPRRDGSAGRRPAQRVRANADPTPVESELFVGELLYYLRPTHSADVEASGYSTKWHFGSKTRTWEIRMQGRFKRRPQGDLFIGLDQYDFDYSATTPVAAHLLKRIVLPLFRQSLKVPITFSWGDRSNAAPDPESLMLMAPAFAGFDQIIVTPPGEAPPLLTGDLSHLGSASLGSGPSTRPSLRATLITSTALLLSFLPRGPRSLPHRDSRVRSPQERATHGRVSAPRPGARLFD